MDYSDLDHRPHSSSLARTTCQVADIDIRARKSDNRQLKGLPIHCAFELWIAGNAISSGLLPRTQHTLQVYMGYVVLPYNVVVVSERYLI